MPDFIDKEACQQRSSDTHHEDLIIKVRQHLEEDLCFRGRTSFVGIVQRDETIILSGQLPSYHLKQLLQEAVRRVPGVQYVENQTHVK